ncbi:hypothetical protein Tco_1039451 [Tanacetum coccineum]
MFQDFRYSDTTHLSRSVEVLKLKKFQERCNIKAFQEWYEHVGPEVASPQDGKVTRWRRDCAWLMISRCSRSQCQIQVQGTSSIQEVNDHYNIFTRESQEYELKTKDKAYILQKLPWTTICAFPTGPELSSINVEKPDPKITEAREKKDQQALLKAKAKRADEGGVDGPQKKRRKKKEVRLGSERTISIEPLHHSHEFQHRPDGGSGIVAKDAKISIVDLSEPAREQTPPQNEHHSNGHHSDEYHSAGHEDSQPTNERHSDGCISDVCESLGFGKAYYEKQEVRNPYPKHEGREDKADKATGKSDKITITNQNGKKTRSLNKIRR